MVATTFQGQFKNTVICGECGHVSVSFEPFMFLTVPLPHATDRQFQVVVVGESAFPSTHHLLTLSTHDRVSDLLASLTCQLPRLAGTSLQLVEVSRSRYAQNG